MKTIDQIARDMREGTFPKKSEATIREEEREACAEWIEMNFHRFPTGTMMATAFRARKAET